MEYFDGSPLRHLGDLTAMGAQRYGDKTAVALSTEERSFDSIDDRASRAATVLRDHGVEPGDRVALYVPNTPGYVDAFFGAVKAGAVPLPLNLRMDTGRLAGICERAGADHLVGSPMLLGGMETERVSLEGPLAVADAAGIARRFVAGVDAEGCTDWSAAVDDAAPLPRSDRPERAFDDVVVHTYTSGTTGTPKGVPLTHENVLSAIAALTTSGLSFDPDDAVVVVLPLFHVPTFTALLAAPLYEGATAVLQAMPDPEGLLRAVEQHGVTMLPGVPALHEMLLETYLEDPESYDVSSLDALSCAAAPLPEDTAERATEAFGVGLAEGWGMTETTTVAVHRPPGVYKPAGCVGKPVRGLDARLVDPETDEVLADEDGLDPRTGPAERHVAFGDGDALEGELVVRGPQVFEGYHDRPEATEMAFDGDWFHTGDVARVDRDGDLWIVDRVDDMLIVGGENVYPAEVEEALHEHPDVGEAAVVAAPHEVKGEAPVAFVVPAEGADTGDLDGESLRSFALERVPSYAHPRRVFAVEELPHSATEKVQRHRLEDEATERIDGALGSSEKL